MKAKTKEDINLERIWQIHLIEKAYRQNKEKSVLILISERAKILDVHFSSKTAYNIAVKGWRKLPNTNITDTTRSKDYYDSVKNTRNPCLFQEMFKHRKPSALTLNNLSSFEIFSSKELGLLDLRTNTCSKNNKKISHFQKFQCNRTLDNQRLSQ